MAYAAKVLLFIQDFCTTCCITFCTTFCTDQTRNDGLVICCNPYP
jgi:hypothetical protein